MERVFELREEVSVLLQAQDANVALYDEIWLGKLAFLINFNQLNLTLRGRDSSILLS